MTINLAKISNKTSFAVAACAAMFWTAAVSANPVVLPDPVASTGPATATAIASQSGIRVVAPPAATQGQSVVKEVQTNKSTESAIKRTWAIRAGQPIHTQIREWATLADWDVRWSLNKSWVAPADVEFSGEFIEALSALVNGLYEEGRPVKLLAWTGNRYAEIVGSDAN